MSNPRIKIYLAAPLFNPTERAFNHDLATRLSSFADVFLPQRDGALLTNLVTKGQSVDTARDRIFNSDTAAIAKCDLVVAILDGRTIDEGVAFELGYAYALRKICVGYKSDDRVMLPTGDNPMIIMACQHQCHSISELFQTIRSISLELISNRPSLIPSRKKHPDKPKH